MLRYFTLFIIGMLELNSIKHVFCSAVSNIMMAAYVLVI